MHTITLSRYFVLSLILVTFIVTTALAQSENEPSQIQSFDVKLQALVGSNDATSRTDLPSDLSSITQRLNSDFRFTGYHLVNTFIGRISDGGNLEYKSVSHIYGKESEGEPQALLDWGITGVRSSGAMFQAQSFRFGSRVPLVLGGREENGRMVPAIGYEPIGLNVARISVPAGVPTLIGTLSLPKTSGTLFLVLTVRPSGK